MKREEFDQLIILERFDYIDDHGNYIDYREYGTNLVALYALNGFFVEVHYKNGKNIFKVESITEDLIMDLYMNDMDFNLLFFNLN